MNCSVPDKENAPKFYDVCRKIVRLREDVELQIKLFVKEKKRGEASSETSINIKSKDDVKALENALWAAASGRFYIGLHQQGCRFCTEPGDLSL